MLEPASRGIDPEGMGFRPLKPGEQTEVPFDLTQPERYPAGQRLEAVEESLARGITQILLTDPPGAGKSHWAANLGPDALKRLGVDRVIVASARHFEQGEEFNLPALRGRGAGLKRTAEGVLRAMGHREKLGPGETQVARFNCALLDQLNRYQERNLNGPLGSLCSTCTHRTACETTSGGFRYERDAALRAPVCVAHPASLQGNLLSREAESEEGPLLPRTSLVMDDLGPASLIRTVCVSLASI